MIQRVRISRFVPMFAVVGLVLTMFLSAPLIGQSASAEKGGVPNGGNSANAKLCQSGGWQSLQNSAGVPFSSEEECTSSGAQGNGVAPTPTVTIAFFPGNPFGYCSASVVMTGFAPSTPYAYEWSFTFPNGSSSTPSSGFLSTDSSGTAYLPGQWIPNFLNSQNTFTVTFGGVTAGPVRTSC